MTEQADAAPVETGAEAATTPTPLEAQEAVERAAEGADPAPPEGGDKSADPADPPKAEAGEEKKPDDLGPRLHGAIQALAQTRQQLAQLKRELAEAQGKTPSRPSIEIPDVNDDPIAALNAIRELAMTLQSEQASEAERTAKETAQTQYVSELKAAYEESEQLFTAIQPDYHDAAQHYVASRTAELKSLGANDQSAKGAIYNELLRLTDAAIQQGRSPAEVLYGLSKARGYAPKPPAPQPGATLAAIEGGQAAAKTLSTAGARTPAADASPEAQIANLSGAALISAWNKIKRGEAA